VRVRVRVRRRQLPWGARVAEGGCPGYGRGSRGAVLGGGGAAEGVIEEKGGGGGGSWPRNRREGNPPRPERPALSPEDRLRVLRDGGRERETASEGEPAKQEAPRSGGEGEGEDPKELQLLRERRSSALD